MWGCLDGVGVEHWKKPVGSGFKSSLSFNFLFFLFLIRATEHKLISRDVLGTVASLSLDQPSQPRTLLTNFLNLSMIFMLLWLSNVPAELCGELCEGAMDKVSIYMDNNGKRLNHLTSSELVIHVAVTATLFSISFFTETAIKSDKVKDWADMSAKNTSEKMKSEENGSKDEENNGGSSGSQATTDTDQNEDIRRFKNAPTAALSKVTKKRNESDRYMADVNDLHKIKATYTELLNCVTRINNHTLCT